SAGVGLVVSVYGHFYCRSRDIGDITFLSPTIEYIGSTVIVKSVGKHSFLIAACRIPNFITYRKLHEQVQVKVSVTDCVGKSTDKVRLRIADDGKVIISDHAVTIDIPVVHVTGLNSFFSSSFGYIRITCKDAISNQSIEGAYRLAFTEHE